MEAFGRVQSLAQKKSSFGSVPAAAPAGDPEPLASPSPVASLAPQRYIGQYARDSSQCQQEAQDIKWIREAFSGIEEAQVRQQVGIREEPGRCGKSSSREA